jgi:hypothetical protein
MFTKSSNLTKSFEGVRIEIETPVDFDTVMKRLHDLTGRASVNEVIGVAAQVKERGRLRSRDRNAVRR